MDAQTLLEEFARTVGFGKRTIERMRAAGRVQHRRVGGKLYYLSPEDVTAFHERSKAASRDERGE